jgi:hypothetical protein
MEQKKLTKTQKRLLKLFNDIEDEDIREIIIEVINIELPNRSSHNFPIRKVRETIDCVARLQESAIEEKGESDVI